MFRVVKTLDEAAEPAYFLLCDHRQCMEARKGTAVVSNGDDYRLTKKNFLKAAIEEGWWVDLEGAFCPAHARDMLHAAKEAATQAQQTVAPARPQDILAFVMSR
jgi:hypothetical protein